MPLLSYIVLAVEFGTLLVGGFRYRNLPRPLRVLEWLVVFTVGEAIIERVLGYLHINNLWVFHVSTLVEYVLLSLLFFSWISHRRSRLVLTVCLVMFIIVWSISKFLFEPFSNIDGWTSALSKILQMVFSIVLLVDVVKESDIIWTNDPRIWVASGIIIYSAGSLFMFALFNEMLQISPDRLKLIWTLNWVLMIISNLLYARGFLCKA